MEKINSKNCLKSTFSERHDPLFREAEEFAPGRLVPRWLLPSYHGQLALRLWNPLCEQGLGSLSW
ncbi:hypothetical protein D8674_002866 [Pyrus ussuriensis x Pyrus communis]|uniref:Uncharacterized protein n=1 Tax=Pyrus ussuriensis x Pyrus communis TaxID=2448454 RepID=A0A5N5FJH8_9ROSA|nr:hypothetical protein D8674_002866 [Pyrus ussuriensis x Pyrus communis]